MSQVRCVYRGPRPPFPPDAGVSRHGPITLPDGSIAYVDAVGAQPTVAEIVAQMGIASSKHLDQHLTTAIAEFSPKEQVMTDTDQAAAPTAIIVPAPAPATPVAASSPGAHALTIKQVLEDHGKKLDQVLQAQLALLMTELDGQVGTVVKGTQSVIDRVRSRTDDFKAILGEFTNDIG